MWPFASFFYVGNLNTLGSLKLSFSVFSFCFKGHVHRSTYSGFTALDELPNMPGQYISEKYQPVLVLTIYDRLFDTCYRTSHAGFLRITIIKVNIENLSIYKSMLLCLGNDGESRRRWVHAGARQKRTREIHTGSAQTTLFQTLTTSVILQKNQ